MVRKKTPEMVHYLIALNTGQTLTNCWPKAVLIFGCLPDYLVDRGYGTVQRLKSTAIFGTARDLPPVWIARDMTSTQAQETGWGRAPRKFRSRITYVSCVLARI